MRGTPEEVLLRIAAQVGDGQAVDWAEEERAHPDLVATLRRMRQLESLVHSYGGYERTGETGTEPATPLGVGAGRTIESPGQEGTMKHVEVETRDEALIVHPLHDLTGGAETQEVVARVRNSGEGGAACVILDLARVGFINSMALGAIIACHIALSRRGAHLFLCNVYERNRRLLAVTKLDAVLQHAESVESALALWAEVRASQAG